MWLQKLLLVQIGFVCFFLYFFIQQQVFCKFPYDSYGAVRWLGLWEIVGFPRLQNGNLLPFTFQGPRNFLTFYFKCLVFISSLWPSSGACVGPSPNPSEFFCIAGLYLTQCFGVTLHKVLTCMLIVL